MQGIHVCGACNVLSCFIGCSLGTAFGAAAVGWFGWATTAILAAASITLAVAVTLAAGAATGAGPSVIFKVLVNDRW